VVLSISSTPLFRSQRIHQWRLGDYLSLHVSKLDLIRQYTFCRMKNALEAIPNDEDLELVYSWQRKQFQNKQAEKEKQLMKKV
jgi:hypothetical protein